MRPLLSTSPIPKMRDALKHPSSTRLSPARTSAHAAVRLVCQHERPTLSDMVSFIKSVTFDCHEPLLVAAFWARALGSNVDEDSTEERAWVEPADGAAPASGSSAFQSPRARRTVNTSTCVPLGRTMMRSLGSSGSAPLWSAITVI